MLLLLLACHPDEKPDDTAEAPLGPYAVDIRWTSWGIPHIQAADHGSLGYGMGYAFARDHACVLADQIVRVRSERARWFGPGDDDANLNSDFGFLGLGVRRQAEEGFATLEPDVQAALTGYAAGYSRYLEEGALPAACAGAPWVYSIDGVDLLTYYLALARNGSGLVFVDAVGTAAPPMTAQSPPPPVERWWEARHPPLGSNGWALGRDKATDGSAMLLSNTHFPSQGELQWHESHLTIPGELDVYGVSLMGVPVINIGFNRHVAWTHTVSFTPRFTAALLELDPENPLRYRYDGGWRDIVPTSHRVEVLQDDGSTESVERTLYSSHWGPVINAPGLGWSSLYAIAFRDANDNNLDVADTWLGLNRATSLDDIEAVLSTTAGDPWVHILAADTTGEVLYADPASTPNWSEAAAARYPEWIDEQPIAALFDSYGAITVDGGDPVFEWVEAGAPRPGIVPYADAPKVRRTDFVVNANDNYWMPNPASPLSGAPWMYGAVETPRSARTRMNLRLAGDVGEGTAAGADGTFTLDEMEAAVLGGRGMIAEELRADVVAACFAAGEVTLTTGPGVGETVDLTAACATLDAWDSTARLDAPGAVLWREFVGSGVFSWDDTQDAGLLWAEPFDPADPVGTPRGLATGDAVLESLGQAVWMLGQAGIAVDAPYRDVQYQRRAGVDHPVPGGTYWEGVIEIANWQADSNATLLDDGTRGEELNALTGLATDGYRMNDGNSYILTVQLSESGPSARAITTYSQSEDPASPHFADQTELYGTEALRPVLFDDAAIEADPELERLTLTLP